ncbi:unnamed protein product [Heligmosomoides polygyrus]|uniref:FHA domain-containing protein n=1 Tax=Heligmosomoides polygyrus TaxID=6339 RepID=A0A3P7ZSG5_HELPZ|nr:unnamed protein product [Heligmosomoides polygyrus]
MALPEMRTLARLEMSGKLQKFAVSRLHSKIKQQMRASDRAQSSVDDVVIAKNGSSVDRPSLERKTTLQKAQIEKREDERSVDMTMANVNERAVAGIAEGLATQWKTSRTALLYKKGDVHDVGSSRPIYLLSVVYKLFTRVILNKISRTVDEGQPCEQAGFRREFSTIYHIHTITKLIEVAREYKLPLCFHRPEEGVETEAAIKPVLAFLTSLFFLYNHWTRAVTDRIPRDVKRTPGRPSTRWSDFFGKALNKNMTLFVPLERRGHIGALWNVARKYGVAVVARLINSMINGMKDDARAT